MQELPVGLLNRAFFETVLSFYNSSDNMHQFKTTKSCMKCVLSDINLSYENYENALLEGSDLSNTILDGANFDFSNTFLIKTSFVRASMRSSNFDYSNFTYAKADRSWIPIRN